MSLELRTPSGADASLGDDRHPVQRQQATEPHPLGTPTAPGRRWSTLVAVATLAALCGAAGTWYLRSPTLASGTASPVAQHGSTAGKATLRYLADAASTPERSSPGAGETVPVEILTLPNRLRVTGSLAADAQSSVASNVNGIVAEVRVDRGSVVKQHDILVRLDATDVQNRLSEGLALVDELKAKLTFDVDSDTFVADDQPAVKLALATLSLAKARKIRADALAAQNAISVDECDLARSELECAVQRHRQSLQQARQDHQAYLTAEARLAALRKAVADTTIAAPFDGLVVEKHVTVGEQVTGGFIASKVITLARTNPLRVCVTVPQQSVAKVRQGQSLAFQVDSFPERTFHAEVRYISPAVTSDTRSLIVEAVTDNPDGALRPGLFVVAELELPEQQAEMWVPVAAVQRSGEVATVYVVRDGVARGQIVALGQEREGKVRIRSGLTGTESLLARPELVQDGDKVH